MSSSYFGKSEKLVFGGIYYVEGYTAHELPRQGPFWKSWTAGRVRMREQVGIMGHSFGGSLVVRFRPLPCAQHSITLRSAIRPFETSTHSPRQS